MFELYISLPYSSSDIEKN